MTKEEVQQRVLQKGKPLSLDKFKWDEKVKVFSSIEDGLVIDFGDRDGYTFIAGSYCIFKAGNYCTFRAGNYCTFVTWNYCTFETGRDCMFKTGSRCTFDTGVECVVVRRDIFEVIKLEKSRPITLCPYYIKGYVDIDGWLNGDKTLGNHIIADGILSRIISRKGNTYKVINHGEAEETFLIKNNNQYAHGKTLKEARESLIYKISNRNTSKYEEYTIDTIVTKSEAIQMYMTITGACSYGTKSFVDKNISKDEYSIKEIIDLTIGQYGHKIFKEFIGVIK